MPPLPYDSWLNSGDNSWQLVAATLVGLMSLPGIAVLYGGIVQKKWVVNTMLMAFTGFSLVLVVWVLWGFKMGFGTPANPLGIGGSTNFLANFVGVPHTVLSTDNEQIASVPLLNGAMPSFRFSETTLVYFQFVFAAITPLLFLGSVIGRISFKVWLIFVPAWSTFAYSINAFLLWGGGWWAQSNHAAMDFSGGYVIHLAAGVTGFTAAAVIGPRLAKDKAKGVPNNLPLAAVGAGILWLGWNGFNGGDPYFAGADASEAVLNTNLTTAVALLTWVLWDMFLSKQKKPTFLGAINGMIVGLVAITPAAGYVNTFGALCIGVIASSVVWFSWNYLARTKLFQKVDDTLGVIHTHGVAGLMGGLLVGVFADPNITVYSASADGKTPPVTALTSVLYGHHYAQLLWQAGAAGTVIIWDAFVTVALLMIIKYVFRLKLRLPDDVLETGDLAIHDEEAYPDESLMGERSDLVSVAAAPAVLDAPAEEPVT